MARDYTEPVEKKYAEERLNRNAKPWLPFCYKCTLIWEKRWIKKESLIKEVTCGKCGKSFKTNSDTKFCFDCRK